MSQAALDTNVDHREQKAPLANRPARFDPELRKRFVADYRSATDQRTVLREYLPKLGADGILDVFENADPLCHNQAHLLGRELFAELGDLAPALMICGDRCTSACMHGVVMEALGGEASSGLAATEAPAERLKAICDQAPMREAYPRGDCAHGVGHALLVLADYDLGTALRDCAVFDSPPIVHYCATGVFMEEDSKHGSRDSKRHYPCDSYKQFPAACYKYKTGSFLGQGADEVKAAAAECLRLEAPLRRGCFYGLGAAEIRRISLEPKRLATVCSFGDSLDRTMCIDGAIDRLGDYRPEAARAACAELKGDLAAACARSERSGRYGLDKPFELYFESDVVTSLRGPAGGAGSK